jgi:hypothetical protein
MNALSYSKKTFDKKIADYNMVIGTQTVGAKYKFTTETNLVETAKAISEMGSNVLKMSMSPRYWWENYDIPRDEKITCLKELAQEKSMKTVLAMDFKYYYIWTYEFSQYTQEPAGGKKDEYQIKFIDGLNDDYAAKSYKEVYDLACYLLKTYSGTGKVFMMGNWEGDWHLRWDYKPKNPANPKTIEGMTRWLNVRQKAIDDAKKNTPHKNVQMFHYVEVNLTNLALKGETCVVNSILPNVNPDYVSFSSYAATGPPKTEEDMYSNLTKHLDVIKSKMKPKKGIKGSRIIIGEYGNSEAEYPQEIINQRAKWIMKAGLKLDCINILFWEMYNNEIADDGSNRGFWLINKKGEKTPLYYTHQNFYKEAKEYLKNYSLKNGKLPTNEIFRKAAVDFKTLN